MKFMKLGSKPDAFQSNGDNIRYVASELSSDLVVNVVDVKFYLHKFPLLSKSARLQKLVDIATEEGKDEIYIQDIPGGPAAFEICAKYCYGMTVTLNAYNVVAARCAAEYLEMHETVEKGNLVYKIEVFLNSSLFRGWKDSIIVLQTTKSLLQWSKELKLITHCLDALASMASIDSSKVEWSYTYNRKKLPSENGLRMEQHSVPNDWWVEDLCDLDVELYKRVINTIKTKNRVSSDVIGEALKAYLFRRLPGFIKGTVQGGDNVKNQLLVTNVVQLLPSEKGSVSCGFLLRLLRAALALECKDSVTKELIGRIAWQLDEASVADLLIRARPSDGESCTVYDVELVVELVKEFVLRVQNETDMGVGETEMCNGMVAKLVDCYLAEVSRDPNLPISFFVGLAELVAGFPRASHDGLYRAIDMFLKEHPGISKSERKRICRLMDCRKLSAEASTHAVQNERLPLRVVVQVLFFEQARGGASLPSGGSHSSSRSATTNTEDDLDGVPTTEELKALKGELACLRIGPAGSRTGPRNEAEKAANDKVKGLIMSKRLVSKLVSGKDRDGENSSSE
ncbi:uncharacterized protein [Phyllobates terribilis]|uniref:uncharacterized protein n=1 Tax=Phyllobates terribilis TaxID=111132 RepID=UPI003CCB5A8C